MRLLELTSASEVLRKFRNGVIHAAALTLDEALLLKQDGFDIKVIMIMDVSHGADAIVARPPFNDLKALQGKTIGVEKSAVGAYLLSRALEANGLDANDFHIKSVEFGEHKNTYLSGKLDAVVTFEPVRSQLLNHGAHVVFDSKRIPDEIVDVLVVRGDYVQHHAEELLTLLQAWFKTLTFMQNEPDKAAGLLAPIAGLSSEDLHNAMDGIRFPDFRENLAMLGSENPRIRTTAEKLQALMVNNNLLAQSVDLNTMFDGKLLERLEP